MRHSLVLRHYFAWVGGSSKELRYAEEEEADVKIEGQVNLG
jgi:hypothetical protein